MICRKKVVVVGGWGSFTVEMSFYCQPERGRAASGQGTDIWLGDPRDPRSTSWKFISFFFWLMVNIIFFYSKGFTSGIIFCHSISPTFKIPFQSLFPCSSCSRPICVGAITVRLANKSLPSEKLPESGQLPSNLPPGHQSLSLLCPLPSTIYPPNLHGFSSTGPKVHILIAPLCSI